MATALLPLVVFGERGGNLVQEEGEVGAWKGIKFIAPIQIATLGHDDGAVAATGDI